MNFFQRLKFVFSDHAIQEHIRAFNSGANLFDAFSEIDRETALKYSAFFACARVLAETFASVSISEYKKLPNGDREQTDETGLLSVLKYAPNDETSSYAFQESIMYQIVLGGNFYAERLKSGNKTKGLLQLDYPDVSMYRDPADRKLKLRVADGGNKPIILDRASEALHIPGPSYNGIEGMSALEYGAGAIKLGDTYQTYGQKFYKNGAIPSGYFQHPAHLKEEAFNRLQKKIKSDYTGLVNIGKPMLLEDNLQFKEVAIKPIDAELLGSKKFQIEDVCRFMRVPPHLVQHLEKSTFNNIEQQSLEFTMYTMLPNFKRVEQNLNFQLLTPRQHKQGYYFEYNIASLLRGDQKTMADAFARGIQWGWLSVNDVRRMLNLNAIENGDTYLRPLNMVPIDTPVIPESNKNAGVSDRKKAESINQEIENLIELSGK